ncbi:peptidoglycan DD-metalloendopeptidase family protein [Lentibacillus salinarum]|uniref:Peptidoglycan DD-metalloendopeptidase family protein n=1 Tax=Lentibacillus salinarum TaxID=446820 RepID=A0ABW3ZWQ8_9BACI
MLQVHKKTEKRATLRFGMLTKIGMMAGLALVVIGSPVYADDNETMEKIYHVYVDDDHIGKVDDKSVIEDLMTEKIDTAEDNDSDDNLMIREDVTFVSERVFNPSFDNDDVTEQLNNSLSIAAEAVELNMADQSVGYFKDREAAETALQQYKTNYADKDKLEQLSADEQENQPSVYKRQTLVNNEDDTKLEPGDTMLTSVTLSEDVSFAERDVPPSDILTVKDGLKRLEKGAQEKKVHHIEKGEVLGDIAGAYDMTIDELLDLNDGLTEDSVLQIDQELNVTDDEPFVDVLVEEEQMKEETIDYEKEVIESDDLYEGEKEVKQEGKQGKKIVHYTREKTNGQVTNKDVIDEKTTEEPVKEIVVKGTKTAPSRGTGSLGWPAAGGHVTSKMGERWGSTHKGIDISGTSNRTIQAADNGTVVSAGYDDGGYGNKVVINHNNGMKTVYAHLSSISVDPGQKVEKGSKIGVMGSTGNSTGVHLHFEVYQNGSRQNPQDHL